MNSILAAIEGGTVWREEGRDVILDILNMQKQKEGLPPLQDHPDKSGTGSAVSKPGAPAKGAAQLKDAPTNHDNDDK